MLQLANNFKTGKNWKWIENLHYSYLDSSMFLDKDGKQSAALNGMLVQLATHRVWYPNGRVPYGVVLEVLVKNFGSIPNFRLMHISASHTEMY